MEQPPRLLDPDLSPEERSAALDRVFASPDLWPDLDADELAFLLTHFSLVYGADDDMSWIPHLARMYAVFVERTTSADRSACAASLTEIVEEGASSSNALLPFLLEEPDPAVAATAALGIAVLHPLVEGDVLSGPRAVLETAEEAEEHTRVGILMGLMLLGDRRVNPLLEGCWRTLTRDSRLRLATLWSGFANAATIDLLLDWLEEESDDEVFGAVAAAVAKPPLYAPSGVTELERVFPVVGLEGRPPLKVLRAWSFEEYGRVIEPRLRAIMDTESEPRVLPEVLRAWGLEP